MADIVLFSAAIPYQCGTHHVNLKPPCYWADIFREFDFVCYDIIRNRIWDNPKIEFWYRQNILLYVHKNKIQDFKQFDISPKPHYLIAPEAYEGYAEAYATLCRKLDRNIFFKIYKKYKKIASFVQKR